jgi:hypothetical protein
MARNVRRASISPTNLALGPDAFEQLVTDLTR